MSSVTQPNYIWKILQHMYSMSMAHELEDNISYKDQNVINGILNGNIDSFEIIIQKYQSYVFSVVNRQIPAQDVEEVAHEAFLRAYKSLNSFKQKTEFRYWLATITIRTCRDYWRKIYAHNKVISGDLAEETKESLSESLQGLAIEQFNRQKYTRELKDLLDWSLGQLSVDDRLVVSLVNLEGYSIEDAATHLGLSKANVKVRAFRGRRKIQKLISQL